MSDLNNILSSFESKFSSIKNKDDLQNLKSEFFGKNGSISVQFKKMGSLNPEERKNFAKELNTIKDQLTSKIEKKFKDFENFEINQKLKDEKIEHLVHWPKFEGSSTSLGKQFCKLFHCV